MIMFGSFLPSLGWFAPPKLTRGWEPTLSWNQFLASTLEEADLSGRGSCAFRLSPAISKLPPPTFPAGNGASKLACQAREAVTVSRLLNGIRSGSSVDSFVTASYLLLPKCLQPKSKVAAYRGRFFCVARTQLSRFTRKPSVDGSKRFPFP